MSLINANAVIPKDFAKLGPHNWAKWEREFKMIAQEQGMWDYYVRGNQLKVEPAQQPRSWTAEQIATAKREAEDKASRANQEIQERAGSAMVLSDDSTPPHTQQPTVLPVYPAGMPDQPDDAASVQIKLQIWKVEDGAYKEYDRNRRTANALLRAATEPYVWAQVSHRQEPQPLFDALRRYCQPSGTMALDRAWEQLDSVRFDKYKNVYEYVLRYEEIVMDIKSAGGDYAASQLMTQITRGLPEPRFKDFKAHFKMTNYPSTDSGFAEFCATLYNSDAKSTQLDQPNKANKNSKTGDKRMAGKDKKPHQKDTTCEACNCYGHDNKDGKCPNKDKPLCTYKPCNKRGHEEKDCRLKKRHATENKNTNPAGMAVVNTETATNGIRKLAFAAIDFNVNEFQRKLADASHCTFQPPQSSHSPADDTTETSHSGENEWAVHVGNVHGDLGYDAWKAGCRRPSSLNQLNQYRYGINNNNFLALAGVREGSLSENTWLVDSGAQVHIVNDRSIFTKFAPLDMKIGTASEGQSLKIEGGGVVQITVETSSGEQCLLELNDVTYAPESRCNLLSVPQLMKKRTAYCHVDADGMSFHTKANNVEFAYAPLIQGLYHLLVVPPDPEQAQIPVVMSTIDMSDPVWDMHRKMGHPSIEYMRKANKVVTGMNLTDKQLKEKLKEICPICYTTRTINRIPREPANRRFTSVGDLMICDSWGPYPMTGLNGERWAVMITDDATRWTWVEFVVTKGAVLTTLVAMLKRIKNEVSSPTRRLRFDNEFLKGVVKDYAWDEGITVEPSVPYHHHHAGTQERVNETIRKITSAQIQDVNPPSDRVKMVITRFDEFLRNTTIPEKLWPYAFRKAVWHKNRLPSKATTWKTPWQLRFNTQPDVSNEHVFGASVYVPYPEEFRKLKAHTKLHTPRGWRGHYLCPETEKISQVWDPERKMVYRVDRVVIDDNTGDDDPQPLPHIHQRVERVQVDIPDSIDQESDHDSEFDSETEDQIGQNSPGLGGLVAATTLNSDDWNSGISDPDTKNEQSGTNQPFIVISSAEPSTDESSDDDDINDVHSSPPQPNHATYDRSLAACFRFDPPPSRQPSSDTQMVYDTQAVSQVQLTDTPATEKYPVSQGWHIDTDIHRVRKSRFAKSKQYRSSTRTKTAVTYDDAAEGNDKFKDIIAQSYAPTKPSQALNNAKPSVSTFRSTDLGVCTACLIYCRLCQHRKDQVKCDQCKKTRRACKSATQEQIDQAKKACMTCVQHRWGLKCDGQDPCNMCTSHDKRCHHNVNGKRRGIRKKPALPVHDRCGSCQLQPLTTRRPVNQPLTENPGALVCQNKIECNGEDPCNVCTHYGIVCIPKELKDKPKCLECQNKQANCNRKTPCNICVETGVPCSDESEDGTTRTTHRTDGQKLTAPIGTCTTCHRSGRDCTGGPPCLQCLTIGYSKYTEGKHCILQTDEQTITATILDAFETGETEDGDLFIKKKDNWEVAKNHHWPRTRFNPWPENHSRRPTRHVEIESDNSNDEEDADVTAEEHDSQLAEHANNDRDCRDDDNVAMVTADLNDAYFDDRLNADLLDLTLTTQQDDRLNGDMIDLLNGIGISDKHVFATIPIHEDKEPTDDEDRFVQEQGSMATPLTYDQAMKLPEAVEWDTATWKEIHQIIDIGAVRVVPRPDGVILISGKLLFKIKWKPNGEVDKFKVRLVARGFMQRKFRDYDESWSPTVLSTSVRIILALVAFLRWVRRQYDIVGAFLNALLKEKVYMMPPRPVRLKKGEVWQVIRALYGLVQSPRAWYQTLRDTLISMGFRQSDFDPCVYIHDERSIIMSIHVDDIGACAPTDAALDWFEEELAKHWKFTKDTENTTYLGMHVLQAKDSITIHQSGYIRRSVKKYGLEHAPTTRIPADPKTRLMRCKTVASPDMVNTYLQKFGTLNYCPTLTRPDVAFAQSLYGRFNANPAQEHMDGINQEMAYLAATATWGIQYRQQEHLELVGYVDADWQGCSDTRRSTTGYVFMLAGGAIDWKSNRQTSVAMSTCEAEYIAAGEATKAAIWIRSFINDLRIDGVSVARVPLHVDNQSAIKLAKNPEFSQQTKHIQRRHHFIREAVLRGDIDIHWIPSKDNLADTLTKPLPPAIFEDLRGRIGMVCADE